MDFHRRSGVSQNAGRNGIHTSLSVSADIFRIDAAGDLKANAAAPTFNTSSNLGRRHIVQEYRVGAGSHRLFNLCQAGNLYFNLKAWRTIAAGFFYGWPRRPT